MNVRRYGCKDKPGALVTVTVPADAETPPHLEIRYPDEDYRTYDFWWNYAPTESNGSKDRVEVPLADLRYIMEETYDMHPNCSMPECTWYKLRKIADET